jgi:hypothetical protein
VFGAERSSAPVPAERRAGAEPAQHAQLATYAAVAVSSVPKPAAAKFVSAPRGGATLPQTATDAELRLWIGVALCGAGLTLMLIWRRRHRAARGLAH